MKYKKPALLFLTLCLLASFASSQEEGSEDFLNEDEFEAQPPGMVPPPPPPPATSPGGDMGNMGGNEPGRNNPTSNGGAGTGGPANPGFNASKRGSGSTAAPTKPKFSEAHPEDITNENFPDLIDSFDYPNAEISDVIKAISELTGKNFIVDPAVRGKITIMAPTRITVAEAYKAFLSALAINGYSIVPSGKFLKITQARAAQRDSIEIYSGAYTPNTDQMITRIVQLKHIQAQDVNKYLRTLTTKDGNLEVYEPTNTLIFSDYGSNVERVMKIIYQLDTAGFEEMLEVIPIRHAKAGDIADLIDKIINKGQSSRTKGGTFTAGIPRFGGNDQKANNAFSLVIPDTRTNAIIVVGNKAGIQKIKDLVRKLDFDIPADEAGGVFVYSVQHGEAEKIAQTLSGIAQAAAKDKDKEKTGFGAVAPPPPPGIPDFGGISTSNSGSNAASNVFGGDVKVTGVKETNSLIITASKQDYQAVLNLLSKIDIPRNQVYVEAIIMEMNTQFTEKYGINYYNFSGGSAYARQGFVESGALTTFANIAGDAGSILTFGSGGNVNIDVGGKSVTVPSLMGFIQLLKSNGNVNILSTPQVLAMDNEEASIEVGNVVPTGTTQATNGTTTTTSIDKVEATISLKLTPHISPSTDSIRMKIKQSIKQLTDVQVKAKNLADSSAVVSTRTVDTNIVVRDGDTAVIGGLMRDQEDISYTKVPILGDIPILGWLFKSKRTTKEKNNLYVFITPKVVRTKQDSQTLLDQKLGERLDSIRNDFGGRDSHGAKVESFRKKASLTSPPAKEESVEE